MISKSQIKFVRSLQQKKFRDEHKMFVVEGIKLVKEALGTYASLIKAVYYTAGTKGHILDEVEQQGITLDEISENDYHKITSQSSPQGIMAVLSQPVEKYMEVNAITDICFGLDGIRDPGNLGTLIRLADWFGINTIICSTDTVDKYNPKVIQSSMGAIFRVNLIYTHLKAYLDRKETVSPVSIYGTSLEGDNLYLTALSQPSIVLFGNESNGLSPEVLQICDKQLKIPNFSLLSTKTESLNVSIAASIICAEFRRQTTYSK